METRRVVLTVSLRRPPRFRVPIADQYENNLHLYDDAGKDITFRHGTARDFVDRGGAAEVQGGPASVFAEQQTLKVRLSTVCDSPQLTPLQVGKYLAYRFELYLSDAKYRILERLLSKLRLYSTEDLQGSIAPHLLNAGANGGIVQSLDVLNHRSEAVQRKYLASQPMPSSSKAESILADTPFSTRWLIEGLVGHGILPLSDVPSLIKALEQACPTKGNRHPYEVKTWTAMQERILTAMFNEERIKDVGAYVKSEFRDVQACPSCRS